MSEINEELFEQFFKEIDKIQPDDHDEIIRISTVYNKKFKEMIRLDDKKIENCQKSS